MKNRKKIQCIALPRSGHHLLLNYLLKYYSGNLSYPETHGHRTFVECKNVLHAGNFHYCEYYHHCKLIPCVDPLTNFQKNHDFENDVQNRKSSHYIIQYRHPLEHLAAHYEYGKIRSMEVYGKEASDTQKNWLEFIYGPEPSKRNIKKYLIYWIGRTELTPDTDKIRYWKNFVNKWIIKNNNPNTYFLLYSDFIRNPMAALEEVIRYISPEEPVKTDFVRKILNKHPIRKARDITEFKFYNPQFFKKIEQFLSEEIKNLNLYTYF